MVWASVWLLVALIPLWRLRATRQLTNPSGSTTLETGANGIGLSPELEREAARRFPNDVAAQLAPLHGVQYQDLYGVGQASPAPPTLIGDANFAASQEVIRQRGVPYFHHYDELERRFPDSDAVRAQRLRDTTSGNLLRSQGPFPNGETLPPQYSHAQVWLARPELEASLRSAREGAQREPDNGFYPWMEALLLFSLDKPNEGIGALDLAGRCSRWSDDTNATVARRIALLHRFRAVDWQDEDAELWRLLFPHFAQVRALARATTGQMRMARRRGDEARALQIVGILQRAGANMARCKDTLIGELVGSAICQIAWRAAIEDDPGFDILSFSRLGIGSTPPQTPEQARAFFQQRRQRVFQQFLVHTRQHGRSDLAQEAIAINATLDATHLSDTFFQSGLGKDAISRSAGRLAGAYVLGMWLLWQTLAGSLAWLACWLVTLRRGNEARPLRAQTVAWSFFCLGASGALLGVWVSLNSTSFPGAFMAQFYGGDTPAPAPSAWIVNLIPFAMPLLWIAPVLIGTALRHVPKFKLRLRGTNGELDTKRITSLALGSVLIGTFAAFYLTDGPKSDIELYLALVWCLCLILAHVLFFVWAPPGKRLARILGIGAGWTGLAALWLYLSIPENLALGLFAALLAFALLGLSLFLTRRKPRSPRDETALPWLLDLALRARVTAGVMALGATLGYLLVALWTIPVEARAGREVQRQLRVGEPAFLREQLQENRWMGGE